MALIGFKKPTFLILFFGLCLLCLNLWAKDSKSTKENVPQIISSPTIPYPEGTAPTDFTEQFDIEEYEQNDLNLNNVYVVCGDSVVDEFEECDDGNRSAGDGCSDACLLEDELACGNGKVDPGETCDDRNKTSNDGCSKTCQIESVCGNGKVEGVEECDDGNQKMGDGCGPKCIKENKINEEVIIQSSGFCGDGVKGSDEECDDKNKENGDGCSSACKNEVSAGFCGDGEINKGEECDDNNRRNGDGCSSACIKEIDDFLPPLECEIDTSIQIPKYEKGKAKVSPPSCAGTCTMKVVKNNCGGLIGEPTWINSDAENKILQGTYPGRNGAEISCQTGQASQNKSTLNQEIGDEVHQRAIVVDCEL